MFKLLEENATADGQSINKEPDVKPDLDHIDGLLKEFIQTYGQSERGYKSFSSVYSRNLAKVIDKLGCSSSVQADIQERIQTFQGRIDKLNELLAIQDEAIRESNNLIQDAMVEYTKAVVEGNTDLIEQLEANKEQLEKNIKQINQRKAILRAELVPFENKRARANKMAVAVKNKIERKLYRKEVENYKFHLKDFSEYVKEFCKTSFYATGGHTKEEIISDIMKELNGNSWGRIS